MKKTLYTLLFLLTFIVSCKKEDSGKLHVIEYEIHFLGAPEWFQSNFVDVMAIPSSGGGYYSHEPDKNGNYKPTITYQQTLSEYWRYEYRVKNGDEVTFKFDGQLSYHYEIRVFIDGVEMSYKEIKVSDDSYYVYTVLNESGLDNTPGDNTIDFIYYEQ